MAEPGQSGQGWGASLQRVARTLLAIVHNRLELLLVEVQEERIRLFETFFLAALAMVLGVMSLAMITLTLVLLLWDQWRVLVLVGLSLLYLAATLIVYVRLRRRMQGGPSFSATLGELNKDKACLDETN
jgi:uncharacterized membrane protein YqjE